jgi:inner membrane protein YhjD
MAWRTRIISDLLARSLTFLPDRPERKLRDRGRFGRGSRREQEGRRRPASRGRSPPEDDRPPRTAPSPSGACFVRSTAGAGTLRAVQAKEIARTAKAVSDRYGADSGGYMAAGIAYYGFLSLLPLMLLGLSVVGFVLAGRPDVQAEVADEISQAVPGLEGLIGENLDRLIAARAGAGLIGLVALLWTGTGVAGAARNALRAIFRQPLPAGIWEDKARLVMKTIGLGVLALSATALTAATGALEAGGPAGVVLIVLVALFGFGLDMLLFLISYRTLMRGHAPWSRLVPGAVFAAVGWTLLKLLGTWYVTRVVGNASAVYGTFASTVGVLVLLYLAARLFLYGAELNAVLWEQSTQGGGLGMDSRNGGAAPREAPGARSTGDLVRSIGTDTVSLVRKEIELARQEVKEGMAARAKGGAAFAAAGVMGLYIVGFLGAAAAAALALVLPLWAALLIVAGVFILAALVAAMVGRTLMKGTSIKPERAKENLKEDVKWARAQLRR